MQILDFLLAIVALACATVPTSPTTTLALPATQTEDEVLASFREHVAANQNLTEGRRRDIERLMDEFGDSVADAITESLIVLYPEYARAIESIDTEDAVVAANRFDPLLNSSDKYLAADASFYLARAFMNEERFEPALSLLSRVTGDLSDYHVHTGQALFYTGIARAGLLQYEEAVQSLSEFLDLYPAAPERLRVAAWRQIQQLRSIESGQLEDIYQRMDFSRRRLALIEPGKKTQQEQDRIVRMLSQLIKDQEKKEASQSQQQQQQQKNTQQQQQQQPQQQQQQSKSQTGGTSNQPNGKVVKKAYNDAPASPWSRLRDRSRDPANNAIKDKLPARYRDIVERYYEAANGDSKK